MKQINVCIQPPAAIAYPIIIGSGVWDNITTWLPDKKSTVVIITDEIVKQHYAFSFEASLRQQGYHTLLLSFPSGEASKTIETKTMLETKMLEYGCDRNSLILALGGGVVGDMAGFIAATYMRGIAYIQIPTTLLAMVDSAVGGKTGIDTPYGKNLIGAFWQPKAVLSNINCLKTLPKNQLINGFIEVLKISLTSDKNMLDSINLNLDLLLQGEESLLIPIIHQAVNLKAHIVNKDAREQGQRSILNFGHTIGHALEQLSHYQLLHGYAVGLGILVESKISQLMGFLKEIDYQFIKQLLHRLTITPDELPPFDVLQVIKKTQQDKKKQAGDIRYVLLSAPGQIHQTEKHCIHAVSDKIVEHAWLEVCKNF